MTCIHAATEVADACVEHCPICQRDEIERLTAYVERLHKDHDELLTQALGVEAERDIARQENERLRAAVWAAIPWMDDLEHMGTIVDQDRRAQTLRILRAAVQQQAAPDVGSL
jgi:hypothetical protein